MGWVFILKSRYIHQQSYLHTLYNIFTFNCKFNYLYSLRTYTAQAVLSFKVLLISCELWELQ